MNDLCRQTGWTDTICFVQDSSGFIVFNSPLERICCREYSWLSFQGTFDSPRQPLFHLAASSNVLLSHKYYIQAICAWSGPALENTFPGGKPSHCLQSYFSCTKVRTISSFFHPSYYMFGPVSVSMDWSIPNISFSEFIHFRLPFYLVISL